MNNLIGRNLRKNEALTNDQMMAYAPSIFAMGQHESRSERYTFIPTIAIIEGLRKEGFLPFQVSQSTTKVEGKQNFTKHMIRFRKEDKISNLNLDEEIPEIILVNSHDGTASYQMKAGIYRLVCTNGLVLGEDYEDYKVKHIGNIKDNVIDVAYRICDDLKYIGDDVGQMKSIELNREEKNIFAKSANILKYDEESPVSDQKLLWSRRPEDNNNTLWSTFNTTQENLVKGGLRGRTRTGRRTTTREIKSIDGNIKLNKALWTLADEMKKLKSQ